MATSTTAVGIDHVTVVPENFDRDRAAVPTRGAAADDRDTTR